MTGIIGALRPLAILLGLGLGASAAAQEHHHEQSTSSDPPAECAADQGLPSAGKRHFMVLAARKGVFYDTSGPSLVALIEADTVGQEAATGAVGLYGDEQGRIAFGAVPPSVYEGFLTEPDQPGDDVMLRLEVTPSQYERVLAVMRSWDRRARERALLYQDDILMNHILFLKQATEVLNDCSEAIDLYVLDWGIEDDLSDDNRSALIPYLFFQELRARNETLHVPDEAMPEEVLALAGSAVDTRGEARTHH